MRVIVDGDACPKINLIEQIANQYNIKTIIFCDFTHTINSKSTIIEVDKGYQSVDMKIINYIKKNDIIITQDYGLASLCLDRYCFVLDPKGKEYTKENIDILLQNRYLNLKSKHKKGPKKRTSQDDVNLQDCLIRIIESMIE